jgi:ethanolamine transporter EutH
MKPEIQNKKKSLLSLVISAVFFIFFFTIFHLDGVKLDYKNLLLLIKIIFTIAILLAGLYYALYFYSGKKVANKVGAGMAIFLIVAFALAGLHN